MHIYKITNNINKKIYIGKEKFDNKNYYGSGLLIVKAIKKYGKENFSKEILELCKDEIHMADREIYWISYFNSCNRFIGYNISKGGTGGYDINNHPDKENIIKKKIESMSRPDVIEKLKMGGRISGKIKPGDATKEKMKESALKRDISTQGGFKNKGNTMSADAKKKMSDAKKGKPGRKKTQDEIDKIIAKRNTVRFYQYDKNWTFIQEHLTFSHVVRFINEAHKISKRQISKQLNNSEPVCIFGNYYITKKIETI